MANHSFAVVGDGNNVGNRTFNYNIYPSERGSFTLESHVAFDALLNSDARYPAPKCHQDTRKCAQNVVKGWLCRKGEGWEKGIMWMSGAPGVGKSAVVQTSCEDLAGADAPESLMSDAESSNHDVDGCFFFARGVESRANMKFFPPTIAYQLTRSRTSCRVSIDKTIAQDPHILKAHFPSQFRRLLLLPAKHLYPMERPITIAIDGLDECASAPDQVELLNLILEAVKSTRMRFLIASRPEQHIHAFFHRGDVSQHTLHVRLDEETFNTSQDIKIFLREEFARIRRERPEACPGKLPNGEDWPGERVLDHLTVESDSQFMIPTLSIGFIDTPFFPPDKQLRILLEAPPSGAFSRLDTLYHKVLSRRPPAELLQGEDDLREYQEVLMGILRVIIAWWGKPLSAAQIAMFLDKPVEAVQAIVRGPMRPLFKFHTSDHDSPITLCHKSLRDYLLDQKRSKKFFIPSVNQDDLFLTLLTRPTSSPLSMHTSSPNILMDVLAAILCGYYPPFVWHTAVFLGMDPIVIEHVVISGPTSVLFEVVEDKVYPCSGNWLKDFLQDANRSGALFISERRKDALLIGFLSRLTPPSPPYTYSQSFLLDVFAIVLDHYAATPANIAALLEVDTSVVEHVVRIGASNILFDEIDEDLTIYFPSEGEFQSFLQDPHRSGEFFVSSNRLDPVFSRILSRQPLSNPPPSSCRDTLMNVVTAVVALGQEWSIHQIASLLHVDDTLVEGIVTLGPTKPLFCMTESEDWFNFSIRSFGNYLQNGTRSGAFFVPDARLDALFIQSLSRLVSFPSCSYFPSLLVDILAVVLWATESQTLEQISAFLEVYYGIVKHAVEVGVVECLFTAYRNDSVKLTSWWLKQFLTDAGRSGAFFVSDRRLDPIFLRILSRQTASDPSPSSSHGILMDVMTVILLVGGKLEIKGIASLLDIDDTLVEGVVKFRPTNALFHEDKYSPARIHFSTQLLRPFLQDAARSKEFFIPQSSVDALLIRILSRGPASGPSNPHSRGLMMDILIPFMGYPLGATIDRITSSLDSVPPSVVEGVVRGPTKCLFGEGYSAINVIRLSSPSLTSFLKDVNRSGELCITQKKLDAFFTKILSPRPPSNPSLLYSKTLLVDVLTVIVSLPYNLTVPRIASALEVNSQVIKSIDLGPLYPLLSEKRNTNITDQPFIDFLTNVEQSGEFFVSPERIDTLFTRILSHQPHSRDVLMGVLAVIVDCTDPHKVPWSTSRLATFLDISPALIDGVIGVGLSRLLFDKRDGFGLSTPLLVPFLKDVTRSAEFCISDRSLDPFFSRILSSPSPPSPPGSSAYSWKTLLKGILTIMLAVPEGMSVLAIGAALGISPSVVESVVQYGPTTSLFTYSGNYRSKYSFSTVSLVSFLQDRERSVDFYISDAVVDALFIRILSLPPPPHLSHFHFKDVLLGVMAAILASPEPCTVPQIAALLNIDRNLVEGVVKVIPAGVLFDVAPQTGKITISSPLLIPFLHDARRSGEFFIPPTMNLDDIPKPWLHHPSTVVGEIWDGGRENEMKWKPSLSAPSRSGSLDTGDKATGSTGTKRPRGSAAPPIFEDGAWVSEVFPMDAGGSEGDTLWNISDEARRAWAVHFEPSSEESAVLADEFWSGGGYGGYGLDYPLAPTQLVGGHVSGVSVANEGYISSGFDEGDNPWAEGL